MSLYAHYIKELRGDGIFENEYGFASYRYLNDGKTIYIIDIYVVPHARNAGVATDMVKKIESIGKNAGAIELWGTVSPSANHSSENLFHYLKYGMKLHSIGNDLIILRKDIV